MMNAAIDIPVCKSAPILGELPLLAWKQLDHVVDLRRKHGDIFTLDVGFKKIVCLCHPAQAQHVLRDEAKKYGKGSALWYALRNILGNGLVVSEGDFWMRQRRMMQPHFHRESLAAMADLMVEAIDEELLKWDQFTKSQAPMDLAVEISRITMRVIIKTVFGSDLDPAKVDFVAEEMRYALDYLLVNMGTLWVPNWFPVPGRQRFKEAIANIDKITFEVIEQRKNIPNRRGGALIDMLVAAVDADTNEHMTHQELRDEAVTLFLAGYETTSGALAFAFRELNRHPRILHEVVDEIDAVVGQRRPGFADARKMPRSMQVLQEALRLDSPSYWIPRMVLEDDVIDGHTVRKGQEVAVMIYALHRHPDFWPDPDRFNPDRFLPEQVQGRHPLAWIPFGAGQRLCIGKEFSLIEGQLILARILAKYDIRPVYQEKQGTFMGATLRPTGGVMVRVSERRTN